MSIRQLLKQILPFLRGQPPLEQEHIERILLVASGSLSHVETTLQSLHARFPHADIVVLIWHTNQRAIHRSAGVDDVIPYRGPLHARSLHQRLSNPPCDLKVALFTGEGQMLLKLLTFLLPARRMLVYTEGGSFSWDFDNRLAVWNLVKARLVRGRSLLAIPRRLGRAILYPLLSLIAVVLLLAWHGDLYAKRRLYRRRRSSSD